MTGPNDWHWPKLIAPFEQVLGPMSPTAPILGARNTTVGQLRGQHVWLVWHQIQDAGGVDTTLTLAMSVGYPVMGAISSDRREREMPPFDESAFFEHFDFRLEPPDVGPRIVVDAQTCFHVRRAFRGGAADRVQLRNGFITTSAEFYEPSPLGMGIGPHRAPTLEEADALVEDLAFLAARVRDAYQGAYAEIAQTQGREAAETWSRSAADAQVAQDRRSRSIMLVFYGAVGCVALAILALTLAFVAAIWRTTGY